jgi:hypothetical protein
VWPGEVEHLRPSHQLHRIWKPVWNILSDGDFELVLANAAHVKNVPGRKTDVSDAAWIADLLAHGLIRSSFVPEQEIQELRELLRTRKQLGRQQGNHIKRLQKTLESANVKLDSVITDIVGKSGRAMIQALIAGQTDPVKLAALADRRIKASAQELREALRGRQIIIVSCCTFTCSTSSSRTQRSKTSIGTLPLSSPGWIRRWRPVKPGPPFKA